MSMFLSALTTRHLEFVTSRPFLKLCIVSAFLLHLVIAYTRNVNWDEFFYLSHVYAHLDGRLDRPFQSAFVHAFGWVQYLPGKEMEQIFVLRLLMTGFLALTCFALYRISKSVTDTTSALIAVVAFLMSAYVFGFGSNFRADPIAAAGLMSALAIIMITRMSALHMLGVAILTALSLCVTVKAVFYLPALVGALYWRQQSSGVQVRIVASVCAGIALAGMLYFIHSSGVTPAADKDTASSMNDALRTALLDNGLFTRWTTYRYWMLLSASSVFLVIFGIWHARSRRLTITLIAFTLPFVVTLMFYRNAFDYFLPFVVPPMMVVIAVGAARVGAGALRTSTLIFMLGAGVWQGALAISQNAHNQRATLAEVHRLFPEPVQYIDQIGMVSSFKRSTFFMSTWGIKRYRAKQQPAVQKSIELHRPPLLLANRYALQYAMLRPNQADNEKLLLKTDGEALRQTYIHYAGAIWLAGRSFTLTTQLQKVSLPFPGVYRLESDANVLVNNELVGPGDTISFEAPFTISGKANSTIRFIWDTGVVPHLGAPLEKNLFAGFWSS